MDETTEMDWLDRQLREAAPYLDDNGFTRSVVQKLPARRRNLQMVRATILLLATLVASALAYVLSGGGRFVTEGLVRHADHGRRCDRSRFQKPGIAVLVPVALPGLFVNMSHVHEHPERYAPTTR